MKATRDTARKQLLSFQARSGEERKVQQEFLDFLDRHPNAADRELEIGHLTASAWIVSPDRTSVLLTHHRKLEKWIPLGGHCDGNFDLRETALREAEEESGLVSFRILSEAPIQMGIHPIPSIGGIAAHLHYDVRFLLETDPAVPLQMVERESLDLRWIALEELSQFALETHLLELGERTPRL